MGIHQDLNGNEILTLYPTSSRTIKRWQVYTDDELQEVAPLITNIRRDFIKRVESYNDRYNGILELTDSVQKFLDRYPNWYETFAELPQAFRLILNGNVYRDILSGNFNIFESKPNQDIKSYIDRNLEVAKGLATEDSLVDKPKLGVELEVPISLHENDPQFIYLSANLKLANIIGAITSTVDEQGEVATQPTRDVKNQIRQLELLATLGAMPYPEISHNLHINVGLEDILTSMPKSSYKKFFEDIRLAALGLSIAYVPRNRLEETAYNPLIRITDPFEPENSRIEFRSPVTPGDFANTEELLEHSQDVFLSVMIAHTSEEESLSLLLRQYINDVSESLRAFLPNSDEFISVQVPLQVVGDHILPTGNMRDTSFIHNLLENDACVLAITEATHRYIEKISDNENLKMSNTKNK